MAAPNTAFEPWLARMTQVAVLNAPRDLIIVAHTAEFALVKILHLHVIGAGAHFESKFVVTHLASKSNSMEPVGKDDRTYTCRVGIPVEQDVSVLPDRRSVAICGKQKDR